MKKVIFLGVFLTLVVPFTSFAALDTNLKYGSSGTAVTELQEFLTAQNVYSGPITGNFYSLTLAAVKAFQTKQNISPVSGYWGPLSRTEAQSMLDLATSDTEEKTETGTVATVTTPVTPCASGDMYNSLTGVLCHPQSGSVSNTVPQQTTTIPTDTNPTPPVQNPIFVYSIQVTSPIVGPDGDTHHAYYAKLGQNNQFNFGIYKGPVTVDQYEAETNSTSGLNPADVPTVVGGGITVTNDSGINFNNSGNMVPSFTEYMSDGLWGNFTIHPEEVGDISVTLTDQKDNVTKNIIIHVQ